MLSILIKRKMNNNQIVNQVYNITNIDIIEQIPNWHTSQEVLFILNKIKDHNLNKETFDDWMERLDNFTNKINKIKDHLISIGKLHFKPNQYYRIIDGTSTRGFGAEKKADKWIYNNIISNYESEYNLINDVEYVEHIINFLFNDGSFSVANNHYNIFKGYLLNHSGHNINYRDEDFLECIKLYYQNQN